MKLIIENNFHGVDGKIHESENGKNLFIEGIYARSEIQNENKRIYRKPILSREINKFLSEKVKTKRAFGELNHPTHPQVNPDRISHRIIDLSESGNDFIGKSLVLDTPTGNIVKGIYEGGGILGVSTRGLGSLKNLENGISEVQDDFSLGTIDIVVDPSAPDAFVNGIMEGKEWIWESGLIKEVNINNSKKKIEKTGSKNLKKIKIEEFKKFLNWIS